MKATYLGLYVHDMIEIDGEYTIALVNEHNTNDYYMLDSMLRLDNNDNFNCYTTETNTSYIAGKLSDCGESARLWRVW